MNAEQPDSVDAMRSGFEAHYKDDFTGWRLALADDAKRRAVAHYAEQARLAEQCIADNRLDPAPLGAAAADAADPSPAALRLRRWMHASAAPQLEAITDPVRECELLLRIARVTAQLLNERRALPYFERAQRSYIERHGASPDAVARRDADRALRRAHIDDLERELEVLLTQIRESIDISLYLETP